ncbi:xanthine dehydrogenase family protein subunit M [Mucilaginibacter sp. RS28]|uniref:Xanthine dehydrogenase family protein subunit M n=1 Tax=Mucilaginibacter straminoryzae TaxID=2932774 RepID=A0A9X2B7F4_9SPHI|nr:xanthine dehydrogenase family protein subunit M [Mucilaginibacter straminoryzae]MCJ8208261.1 xanthine dehydrogenase family protein subunit M [Mucilaginibacter straminoryzae]
MKQFQYVRPTSQQSVIDALTKPGTKIIAGGSNLVDLMKHGVMSPDKLVDINKLPLRDISSIMGNVRTIAIGALALNSQVAEHAMIKERLPLLSQALNAGASAQLRNMATVGGNLMQRTRCPYFYDTALPCNKRNPGSGCGALEGFNRMHAIFGQSEKCIAVHPSDMAVALAALDATVEVVGKKGRRYIAFKDFHRLPGDHPELDNTLAKDELITNVIVPENNFAKNSYYLKVRDRASYAFALVSAAVALDIDNGRIQDARIAMGGVAHKPWRFYEVEKALKGKPASTETFEQIGELAMQGAKAYKENAFKLKLTPATLVEALKHAARIA